MSLPARFINSLTSEEYLEIEVRNKVRHEFVGGEMFAMAGASNAHNIIALNVAAILRNHLRGSGCRAYIADMRVKIETADDFYYPDVMASCEQATAGSLFLSQPFLIIEVLSNSTAKTDRREKLAAYRKIESLREYVVIYQDQKRAELHRKDASGAWQSAILGENDVVFLEASPNGALTLTMDEIYEDVEFSEVNV
jgi:Uma2 family endonuclease